MAPRSGSLVAAVTFEAEVDGKPVLVHAGDVFPANDPIVKGREHLFAPAPPIEQATAAPGEKRRR